MAVASCWSVFALLWSKQLHTELSCSAQNLDLILILILPHPSPVTIRSGLTAALRSEWDQTSLAASTSAGPTDGGKVEAVGAARRMSQSRLTLLQTSCPHTSGHVVCMLMIDREHNVYCWNQTCDTENTPTQLFCCRCFMTNVCDSKHRWSK